MNKFGNNEKRRSLSEMMDETGGDGPGLSLSSPSALHSGVDVLAVGIYSTRYALHRIWSE